MESDAAGEPDFIAVARHWATQTVLFALNVERRDRLPCPTEVIEQMFLRASAVVQRLHAEAVGESAADASREQVGVVLLRKVLAWVGEWDRRNSV